VVEEKADSVAAATVEDSDLAAEKAVVEAED
jgi:hypothetical protein